MAEGQSSTVEEIKNEKKEKERRKEGRKRNPLRLITTAQAIDALLCIASKPSGATQIF